jgi:hypothetical protein
MEPAVSSPWTSCQPTDPCRTPDIAPYFAGTLWPDGIVVKGRGPEVPSAPMPSGESPAPLVDFLDLLCSVCSLPANRASSMRSNVNASCCCDSIAIGACCLSASACLHVPAQSRRMLWWPGCCSGWVEWQHSKRCAQYHSGALGCAQALASRSAKQAECMRASCDCTTSGSC